MKIRNALLLSLPLALLATCLYGAETAFWQVGTFDEFLKGTLRDVSLSTEGELRLAPQSQAVFDPEEALALALAMDSKGNFYIGTGHQGKVFRVDAQGQGTLFFTAEEPDVFALAVGPDGALYVGSSPEGKVYRVAPDGKYSVFFDPKAKYIWALAFDGSGNLFVGTGDQGNIFKISSAGKGEVYFDSNQTHVMCLTFDRAGRLLAGSVPDGLVYRITAQGKGFVLHQAGLSEIHDLAVDAEGRIYAAALGGAGGKGTPQFFAPTVPGTTQPTTATTVTVTAGTEGAPVPSQTPPVQTTPTPSISRPAPQTAGFTLPPIPQGRGALIQILPDYSVETLWSSNNETIFGLAVLGDRVLFSTDSNGRIFGLTPSRDGQKVTLLTQTQESLATRLLVQGSDIYVATSNVAKLFRVGAGVAREGSYGSQVKDTKFVSRWGTICWRADVPAGSGLEFYTRSGNSERPDTTWSKWAGPYRNPDGSPITSPPARYVQWKAVLRTSGGKTPALYETTVSYLNQNLPPQIRSFSVSTSSARTSPAGAPPLPSGSSTSVSAAPSPSVSYAASSGASLAAGQAPTTLSWQADDPNGDQLLYALWVKATDELEWHLVKEKLHQTNYSLEPNTLADGKYVARVVASDETSNPPEAARTAEFLSAPFWVDQTPPVAQVVRQRVLGGRIEIQFRIEDATSPLRHAEVFSDGREWRDVYSDDGVVDSRAETFTIALEGLAPGEHIVTLRVFDTAGNVGVGKAVVRIPAGEPSRR